MVLVMVLEAAAAVGVYNPFVLSLLFGTFLTWSNLTWNDSGKFVG